MNWTASAILAVIGMIAIILTFPVVGFPYGLHLAGFCFGIAILLLAK